MEKVPGFDREVSLDAMAEVLMFQYIGAPRSIYKKVKKLPPGHWLIAKPGQPIIIHRYFNFQPNQDGYQNRKIDDLTDELEEILTRNIRRRLISDVPLGAFLSGGVDSSTVCALIRRKLKIPLKTFSIGFEKAPESEHEVARKFARLLDTEHHDQILFPHTTEFLINIGKILDEPNGDSSCLPTFLLSEFTRNFVTVAISGDGGDEMFGGYDRYFLTIEQAKAREKPKGPNFETGSAYYSDRILVSVEFFIQELFGQVPLGLLDHVNRLRRELDESPLPLLGRLRKTDVDNYMPGAVLPKVDRMSMRHSLEVRTPFLNMELARFAEGLSESDLYGSRRGKVILRRLAYRYLPSKLIDLPKKGFGLPMSDWARNDLLKVTNNLLRTEESILQKVLGADSIQKFWNRQNSVDSFSPYQVWGVCMLESWLRNHNVKLDELVEASEENRIVDLACRPRFEMTSLQATQDSPRMVFKSLIKRQFKKMPNSITKPFHNLIDAFKLPAISGLQPSANKSENLSTSNEPATGLADFLRAFTKFSPKKRFPLSGNPENLKPHVVVLTHALSPGGAERQWCYLADGLKDCGIDVTFVVYCPMEGSDAHYLPLLSASAIPIIDLSRINFDSCVDMVSSEPNFLAASTIYGNPFGQKLLKFSVLLRLLKPTAIFSQLDFPNLLAGFSSVLAGGVTTVMSFRNYNPTHFHYLAVDSDWMLECYQTLMKYENILCSGNSTLANDDYAEWIGIERPSIKFVPNIVDKKWFELTEKDESENTRLEFALSKDTPVVLGIFRLNEEKRPLSFLEVCSRIVARLPSVRILIAGVGPMSDMMEARIKDLNLERNVSLLGLRNDVKSLMSVSTLLLQTSRYEGMPNSILEAQATGLPVVATDVGGTKNCVRNEVSGFLYDPDDLDGMVEGCLKLLTDKTLHSDMSNEARKMALDGFSKQNVTKSYIELAASRPTNSSANVRTFKSFLGLSSVLENNKESLMSVVRKILPTGSLRYRVLWNPVRNTYRFVKSRTPWPTITGTPPFDRNALNDSIGEWQLLIDFMSNRGLKEMAEPVSLVTVLYNKQNEIKHFINALARQTFSGHIELIVVDNHSSDNSVQILQDSFSDHKLRNISLKLVVNDENAGNCTARNTGVLHATGSIVIIVDADSLLNKDFVRSHYWAHKLTACAVVIGPHNLETKGYDPESVLEAYERDINLAHSESDLQDKQLPNSFLNCVTRNFSIKRSAISEDLFDPEFSYSMKPESGFGWEDVEMGYRLYKRGVTITYCPLAVSVHISHPSSIDDSTKSDRSLINFCKLFKKHPELSLISKHWAGSTYNKIVEWRRSHRHEKNKDEIFLEENFPIFRAAPSPLRRSRRLRILTYRWHCAHQYELYKLPHDFTLLAGICPGFTNSWDFEQRPFPGNAKFKHFSKLNLKDFDLAILHFDENVLAPANTNGVLNPDWGAPFKWFSTNVDLPKIAICHGTPQFYGQYDKSFIAEHDIKVIEDSRKQLVHYVGEMPVICNSHQAQKEWEFISSKVIWHGFDPSEFPPTTYSEDVLSLGPAMQERPHYRGYFLYEDVVGRLPANCRPKSLKVQAPDDILNRNSNIYATAKFQNYVKEIRRYSIYFNPTWRSPMPRSRGEAMMCGLVPVSANNHDVNMFIRNGDNGFFSNDPEELAEFLTHLCKNKKACEKMGNAARNTAMEIFSSHRYLEDWQETLQELIGSGRLSASKN